MFVIYKLRAEDTIDYAAGELKKYLRMMMPECGEIDIRFDPHAKDGFRLGLFEDLGMENPAEDPILDDIIHVETTAEGGILTGFGQRSRKVFGADLHLGRHAVIFQNDLHTVTQ